MTKKLAKIFLISLIIGILSLMTALFAYAEQNTQSNTVQHQEGGRGYLGVQVRNSDAGVVVVYVVADSPAEIAGLEINDIILQVNDIEIATSVDLVREVQNAEAGDSLVLTVLRGNETLELTAEISTVTEPSRGVVVRPDEWDGSSIEDWGDEWSEQFNLDGQLQLGIQYTDLDGQLQLGVQYTNLTPEIAATEGYGVDEGAYITEVFSDTPAEDAGLQVGDIITAVDGDAVDIEHTLSDRLYAYETQDRVIFIVHRGDDILEIGAVLASEHPAKRNNFNLGGNGSIFVPNMHWEERIPEISNYPWSPDAGDSFPWQIDPIEIDILPTDGNFIIQMSTEPPALENLPADATVYECTLTNHDNTMYIITNADEPPLMMTCELYEYPVNEFEG